MDLYIKITDENGDTLRLVNIWTDGSDSECAEEITEWITENYDGAKEVTGEEAP